MKREHALLMALAAVLALTGLLIWGFLAGRGAAADEAAREANVKADVRVSQNSFGAPTLTLSPELQRQADIRVMEPTAAPYQQEIKAYASVLELQSFTALSNTLASTGAQRVIARAKVTASRDAFERAKLLYENDRNFSEAQLQTAEAAYQSDEASLRAADVQAQNAEATAYQAWGPVLGRSLASNTALAQELIRHEKVLIQVTLPLGVALPVSHGSASVETPTGERVPIELVSAAIRTDPHIQGPGFFYTAQAASGLLPGMNVMARLPAGRPAPGIFIPASAIVWMRGRAWVYLRTGENAFTRREISTAQPRSEGGYIEPAAVSSRGSGSALPPVAAATPQAFPANEPLVVSGAQSLLSQEFSAQTGADSD